MPSNSLEHNVDKIKLENTVEIYDEMSLSKFYWKSFSTSILTSISIFVISFIFTAITGFTLINIVVLFFALLIITLPFAFAWAGGNTLFIHLLIKHKRYNRSFYMLPGLYTFIVSVLISIGINFWIVMSSDPNLSTSDIFSLTATGTVLFAILGITNWFTSIIGNFLHLKAVENYEII